MERGKIGVLSPREGRIAVHSDMAEEHWLRTLELSYDLGPAGLLTLAPETCI